MSFKIFMGKFFLSNKSKISSKNHFALHLQQILPHPGRQVQHLATEGKHGEQLSAKQNEASEDDNKTNKEKELPVKGTYLINGLNIVIQRFQN